VNKSLDELLQPGNKVRRFYNKGNPNNCVMHIRTIVDDEWIVYRVWWKGKQTWHYVINHRYRFELNYEKGRLSYAGRSKL